MAARCEAVLRVTLLWFDTRAAYILLWSKINFYGQSSFRVLPFIWAKLGCLSWGIVTPPSRCKEDEPCQEHIFQCQLEQS